MGPSIGPAGGAIATIAEKKYLPTVVTVVQARAHFDAVSGGTTLIQLKNWFKQNEEFMFRYDGTKKRLTLPWHLITSLATELLVFGPLSMTPAIITNASVIGDHNTEADLQSPGQQNPW